MLVVVGTGAESSTSLLGVAMLVVVGAGAESRTGLLGVATASVLWGYLYISGRTRGRGGREGREGREGGRGGVARTSGEAAAARCRKSGRRKTGEEAPDL